MGTSFQEQLLKAGLVNEKQVKKAAAKKRAGKKKKNKSLAPVPSEPNETRQEKLAQEALNREKNRQLNQEKLAAEIETWTRQVVEEHRIPLKPHFEDPYHFVVGKKIKKLYVTQEMIEKLSKGTLAVVRCNQRFEIVPAAIAQKIAERDPDAVVVHHEPEK